jgi:hypothetical protein
MVSFWWVLAGFMGGGFAGVLVMAMVYLVAEPEHSHAAEAGGVGG